MKIRRFHFIRLLWVCSALFLTVSCLSNEASNQPEQDLATATLVPIKELTPPLSAPALAPPKTETPAAPATTIGPVIQAAPAEVTGVGTPGEPYAGAPLCPTHDNTQWHSLWDAARGCHYDHTHNADPASADAVFGPAGALFQGQSISYPWQTPNENQYKHQGYKYAVGLNLPCVQDTYEYLSPPPDCVGAFRIQHHDLGGPLDAVVRFHSYFAEVQVCRRDGSSCGIVRAGGHSDFGILHVPYKQRWIPLPQKDPPELWQYMSDPSQIDLNVDPYRAYNDLAMMQQMRTAEAMCKNCQGPGRELRTTWAGATQFGHTDWAVGNQIVGFQFWTFDDWGGFDPNNLADYQLVCPDMQCRFNSSEHALYTVSVDIAAELDEDGDGMVNYNGFTDLNGTVVDNCSAAGLNCVPLVIEHTPVGRYLYSFQAPTHDVAAITHDYDLSPEGVWWIHYPN